MTVADRYVSTDTLSHAWLQAVAMLHNSRTSKTVHLMLRIADPSREEPEIHAAAQRLIDTINADLDEAKHLPDVVTTRNTMFPASWASRHPEPAELAAYYRARYRRLRTHPGNSYGTYFGRMVAYPRESKHNDTSDQLSDLVRKIRDESKKRKLSSRYEVNIYSERYDTNPMSFPCMAHLSFHMHEGALHQQAVYRNEYLVARAYGNYLGLAQLQVYLATACGLEVGEFAVTIGHVELDATVRDTKHLLTQLDHHL